MMETQVKALTILLSALGAFCLWEFRVFSTNLNILRSICSGHGDPARRGSDGGPRRFTAVVPTPHAYSGQWPVKMNLDEYLFRGTRKIVDWLVVISNDLTSRLGKARNSSQAGEQ